MPTTKVERIMEIKNHYLVSLIVIIVLGKSYQ